MGRSPCCSKVGLHRGPWTAKEDSLLTKYIQIHGEGHWRYLPKKAGLLRCGKSCRLRWMNYLRPDIKRGNITPEEDDLIIKLHALLGNRWSLIAGRLPGRTDNEIKNYWNTHLSRRLRSQGTDPSTHKKLPDNPPLEPKNKRKNNTRNNKNQKFDCRGDEGQMTKVYHPKPIRLASLSSFTMSRNNSFDGAAASGCSSHGGFEKGVANAIPWSSEDGDGVSFLIGDDQNQDFLNVSDLESHQNVPSDESILEKLYEEYSQLLKTEKSDQLPLDALAESY